MANAARILLDGGLVVFPTETVYGLGADAGNHAACQAVYAAKGRPADNPLIVHLYSLEQLEDCVAELPDAARRLYEAFSPAPSLLCCRSPSAFAMPQLQDCQPLVSVSRLIRLPVAFWRQCVPRLPVPRPT